MRLNQMDWLLFLCFWSASGAFLGFIQSERSMTDSAWLTGLLYACTVHTHALPQRHRVSLAGSLEGSARIWDGGRAFLPSFPLSVRNKERRGVCPSASIARVSLSNAGCRWPYSVLAMGNKWGERWRLHWLCRNLAQLRAVPFAH